MDNRFIKKEAHILNKSGVKMFQAGLVLEEPLAIRVEGNDYTLIMRTPGQEIFHAAGFCLAEGLVEKKEDFASIGHCPDMDPNVVEVKLVPERLGAVENLLGHKSFMSQTSCGICGRELIEDLSENLIPVDDKGCMSLNQAMECLERLPGLQELRDLTRAVHGAMLLDENLEILSMAEDVGRHNALDKAVGQALMGDNLQKAFAVVLSSRMSFEMIQKAARAGLNIILAYSRPTALAVELGNNLNMTLACRDKKGGLIIFCNKSRIRE